MKAARTNHPVIARRPRGRAVARYSTGTQPGATDHTIRARGAHGGAVTTIAASDETALANDSVRARRAGRRAIARVAAGDLPLRANHGGVGILPQAIAVVIVPVAITPRPLFQIARFAKAGRIARIAARQLSGPAHNPIGARVADAGVVAGIAASELAHVADDLRKRRLRDGG